MWRKPAAPLFGVDAAIFIATADGTGTGSVQFAVVGNNVGPARRRHDDPRPWAGLGVVGGRAGWLITDEPGIKM